MIPQCQIVRVIQLFFLKSLIIKKKNEEKNKRKENESHRITGEKRTELRGNVVCLEGCCQTSPLLIGELINGAFVRTWKKQRVPCDYCAHW